MKNYIVLCYDSNLISYLCCKLKNVYIIDDIQSIQTILKTYNQQEDLIFATSNEQLITYILENNLNMDVIIIKEKIFENKQYQMLKSLEENIMLFDSILPVFDIFKDRIIDNLKVEITTTDKVNINHRFYV